MQETTLLLQRVSKSLTSEMDSVEAHFDMVKTVKDEIGAKNNELEKNVNDLDGKYKAKYESLAAKTYTTQEEQEKAQEELRQYAENLKLQKDDYEQKYQDFVMRKNLAVKTRIEDFLKKFNSDNRYSYIISYEIGLFYYRDTAYNITNQLIKGLNEDYRNNKPAPKKIISCTWRILKNYSAISLHSKWV
jgi:outer membrane protein